MSDKTLTESEWKKISKGKSLKDVAFIKALAALEKAGDPDATLKALDEVETQAEALRKAGKGDDALGDYFDDLEKALGKARKQAEAGAKKASKSAGTDDDEEEDPALLTSKMLPVLRQIKKGQAAQVLVAVAGKACAVMLSKRSISPARRKMLADYLAVSGLKYIKGECLFEERAYTFVLPVQAAGLAKKLKKALLEQVELRLKVRVRGEDGELDDDGDADDDIDDIDQEPAEARTAPTPPADPQQAIFEARLAKLEPSLKAAASSPAGAKLSTVLDFARDKADAGAYQAALAALDQLDKLLAAATSSAVPPPAAADRAVDGTAAFTARLAALMPRIKQAAVDALPGAADIKLKVAEAGAAARDRDFPRGQVLLDEVEALLARPAKPAAEPAADPAVAEYEALHQQLAPQVEALARSAGTLRPPLAEQYQKLQLAWGMALDSAGAGKHARAVLVLKKLLDGGLVAALQQGLKEQAAGGAAPAEPGRLVQQRKFLLTRWARIPAELKVELGGLEAVISERGADDDPAGLVAAIGERLTEFLSELQDEIDQAITDGDSSVFKGLRERVEKDSLIGHLLNAPFFDGSKFKTAMLSAVDEIEAALST